MDLRLLAGDQREIVDGSVDQLMSRAASPTPMLTTTLTTPGICITLAKLNFVQRILISSAALLQPWLNLLCGSHRSQMSLLLDLAKRTRLPDSSSTRTPTRWRAVESTTITLETWIEPPG